MEYQNIKCPVCNKEFQQGEDIVVCPDCGTPHHRECYEALEKCANQDKHKDGYIFNEKDNTTNKDTADTNTAENNDAKDDLVTCPRCKSQNPKNMFYCGKCGYPINLGNNNGNFNGNTSTPGTTINLLDPMGGVDPEEDMGDGVTAGEMSKYVQKNTSYFSRVFYNIKKFNRGRFSFVGFLFSGGYLLYRKMYKIGGIITGILLVLMLIEAYIMLTPDYRELLLTLENAMTNIQSANYTDNLTNMYNTLMQLPLKQQIINYYLYFSSIVQLVIKIVVGVMANKWYFKHCKKEIKKIKKEEKPNLETKGGVNITIAVCLFVVYLIITRLPSILLNLNLF